MKHADTMNGVDVEGSTDTHDATDIPHGITHGIIFDMDGVIIDSEPVHRRVERACFDAWELPVTEAEHDDYLGTSGPDMFADIAERHPRAWAASGLTISDAVERERRRYQNELEAGRVPAVPGAVALITSLSVAGWAVAIASSAPVQQIETVLDMLHLRPWVTCIRSADHVERSKPDPAIFVSAASCLNLDPGAVWVIEDSHNGIAAARSAGMRCIAYRNPASGTPDLTGADAVVDHLSEVPARLEADPETTRNVTSSTRRTDTESES